MVLEIDVELPDQGDHIIRTKDLDVTPNPEGLAHELFVKMKRHTDAVAQIDAENEECDIFESLLKRCVRVSLHLKSRGITSQDIVSPCTSNHMNSTVAMISPLLIGAKIACLDPFTTVEDLEEAIRLVKPKLVFACKEAEEKIEGILEKLELDAEIVVFGNTSKHTPFEKLLEPFPKEDEADFYPFIVKDLSEIAMIIFSGGSTGIPKAICFDHNSILHQLERLRRLTHRNTNAVSYATLACVSAQISTAASLLSGNYKLICSSFDPAKTWRFLVKYDVKSLALSPVEALAFLRYGNPDSLATPQLRSVIITGGKLNLDHISSLKKLFFHPIPVICTYHQSEVFGPILGYENFDLFMTRPGSSGTPISSFWYKVVDPKTGKNCGPNERGEIRLKSNFCMKNYYEQTSSNSFDDEGFLKTDDMAYYDEDHCFFIVDRMSDVLKYKTHWVPSSSLEAILYEHPAVKIACIVDIPAEDGDIAVGVVVKSDAAKDVTQQELIDFFNGKVEEKNKIRGGIIFVEESTIPYTASGTIRKFMLCKTILDDLNNVDLSVNLM